MFPGVEYRLVDDISLKNKHYNSCHMSYHESNSGRIFSLGFQKNTPTFTAVFKVVHIMSGYIIIFTE